MEVFLHMTQICYYMLNFNVTLRYIMSLDVSMVEHQNQKLDESIHDVKDRYSTDNQKSYYLSLKKDTTNMYVNILIFVYYVVGALTAYIIFVSKSIGFTNKLFLVLLIAIYPFIATSIFVFLYQLLMYVLALIKGTPYERQ